MNEEHQILFERYLNSELSDKELTEFTSRLDADSEFKSDFELFKEMQGFLESKDQNENALKILKDVHDSKKEINQKVQRSVLWKYSIAASVLILISFSIWHFHNKEDVNNLLFPEVYVEAAWPDERGQVVILDSLINDFRINKNESSLISLKLDESIDQFSKNYWLAELYIHNQNPDSCLVFLNKLNGQDMGILKNRIIYLKALSYFLQNDTTSLENLIGTLPQNLDKYYEDRIRKLKLN